MKLSVLLPSEVLLERDGVLRIVAETRAGSFGLLPHRRDCVAALTAGILTFETKAEGEVFVAVDEGALVKTSGEVRVSVRRAIVGADLAELRTQVEREFKGIDQHERTIRSVMEKLESGFLHRLAGLRNDWYQENHNPTSNAPGLAGTVGSKAARKLKARRHPTPIVWSGLGMMGLIGWSVVVPTLIGAGIGLWLDKHHPSDHSWTLALLMAGLTLGCANAWHWVAKENKAIHDEQEDTDA